VLLGVAMVLLLLVVLVVLVLPLLLLLVVLLLVLVLLLLLLLVLVLVLVLLLLLVLPPPPPPPPPPPSAGLLLLTIALCFSPPQNGRAEQSPFGSVFEAVNVGKGGVAIDYSQEEGMAQVKNKNALIRIPRSPPAVLHLQPVHSLLP